MFFLCVERNPGERGAGRWPLTVKQTSSVHPLQIFPNRNNNGSSTCGGYNQHSMRLICLALTPQHNLKHENFGNGLGVERISGNVWSQSRRLLLCILARKKENNNNKKKSIFQKKLLSKVTVFCTSSLLINFSFISNLPWLLSDKNVFIETGALHNQLPAVT